VLARFWLPSWCLSRILALHPGVEGPSTKEIKGIIGSRQSGGPQSGDLQSRATDFGSDLALSCSLHWLGACSLGPQISDLISRSPLLWGPIVWGPQSRATDFGSDLALTCVVGACSVGAYILEPPTFDLILHLPVLYIDWGPTVSGHRLWIWPCI